MSEKSEHIIRQEHYVHGYENGVESERERIIAMLEQLTLSALTEVGGYVTLPRFSTAHIIEMIREANDE